MKTLLIFLTLTLSINSFGQVSTSKNNRTEADKTTFKKGCLLGLENSNSTLTNSQRVQYCDCAYRKIVTAYPDKHTKQDINLMRKLANDCIRELGF